MIKTLGRLLGHGRRYTDVHIGKYSRVSKDTEIGAHSYIGRGCEITRARMGRYVSIGNNVCAAPITSATGTNATLRRTVDPGAGETLSCRASQETEPRPFLSPRSLDRGRNHSSCDLGLAHDRHEEVRLAGEGPQVPSGELQIDVQFRCTHIGSKVAELIVTTDAEANDKTAFVSQVRTEP